MQDETNTFELLELPPPPPPAELPSKGMLGLLAELTERVKAGKVLSLGLAFEETDSGVLSAYHLERGATVTNLHYAATLLQQRVFEHGMGLSEEDVD